MYDSIQHLNPFFSCEVTLPGIQERGVFTFHEVKMYIAWSTYCVDDDEWGAAAFWHDDDIASAIDGLSRR